MALMVDMECQLTGGAVNKSNTYQFPDLHSWLNDLKLSHIYDALREEDFETLEAIVALNEDDLDELCGEIKSNLKKRNKKFTLGNKGLFKSKITKEKEKYHQYLATINTANNSVDTNKSFNSLIVTKEEREALQTLNARIKVYDDIFNLVTKANNDAKSQKLSAIKSISEISKRFEMVLTNLGETAFAKYLKYNNNAIKYANNSLLKLKETKKQCEQTLSIDNNKKMDVVKMIKKIIEQTDDIHTDKFQQKCQDFVEEEIFGSLIHAVMTDINITKIAQQFISFMLVSVRNIFSSMKDLEDHEENERQTVKLMILPHAVEYIEDIKNELKQRNIKIVGDTESISNDQALRLLIEPWLKLIGEEYDESLEKDETEEDQEEKKDVEDDEKDDDIDFDFDPVENEGFSLQILFSYHLNKYFERINAKITMIKIEIPKYNDDMMQEIFSDNYHVYVPAIFGEYASIYHPESINGKFMNMYRQKTNEQDLNLTVNLGFIQVIGSIIDKEMEITLVGLQNSGKSAFVYVMQNGEYVSDNIKFQPTVGFNMHRVDKRDVSIKVWDLGGYKKFRGMWERYCRKNDAIVYMVDAAYPSFFPNAKKELYSLLSSPSLNGIPLLLLFNKNDLPDARPADEIIEALGVKQLKGREIAYYEISCKDVLNIDIASDWLIKHRK